ncbi:MAG: hypothetical protein HQK65_07865 [Desulfamplus sp.]|nr:hypothetical protein [Desulfamplus sp.]
MKLERVFGKKYWVLKESGIGNKVLDRRKWPCESLELAEKLVKKKIKEKTNPDRRSPRKYRLV